MSEQRTITVYNFDELSSEAKDRVCQWFNSDGYHFAEEALDSLKKLAEHFNGKLVNWSIDLDCYSRSSASFRMPDIGYGEFARLLGELGTYDPTTLRGNGDCKLTGVCSDEWAIDGLREAFAAYMPPDESTERFDADGDELDDWDLMSSEDVTELMQSAFHNWLKIANEDWEYQCSEEYVKENCEANDYMFYENGELA